MFGTVEPEADLAYSEAVRHQLDSTTWVDLAKGWLQGSDRIFDLLYDQLTWIQRRDIKMYDSLVDEPRLSAWWRASDGEPEPLPLLTTLRTSLAERYDEPFDSIGFNLYRDGNDSVAWHADRHAHVVTNPVIAIVSVGAPRPLKLRPKGGGHSTGWDLGNGDLLVMGGACQHEWEHTVPKVKRTTGPRMSITFRSV